VLVVGCGAVGLLIIQVLRCRLPGRSWRSIWSRSGWRWPRGLVRRQKRRSRVRGRRARWKLSRWPYDACAREGLTLVGNLALHADLPLQDVVTREISLLGSCASSGEYPACIELMASGAIDVGPLISATAPLEDGPAWFDRLYAGNFRLMKVILQP
jgi:threonine dehydrogenase-like Zn-dependent dehydrogenase